MAKANPVPTALCTPVTGAKGNHSTNSIRLANTQVPLRIVGRRPRVPFCPIVSASNDGLRLLHIISENKS